MKTIMASPPDTSKTTKLERYNSYIRRVNSTKLIAASSKLLFRVTLLVALLLIFFFTINYPPLTSEKSFNNNIHTTTHNLLSSAIYGGGASWEKQVRHSSTPHRPNGLSVLVTGAAGFVGSHCSLALKKRGDGVLGLDNFNSYYDPSLKRARQDQLSKHQIFIVEGDINDTELLKKLFDIVPFTHILHLAAQAGVRYAMQNPLSYVNSNVAGFVNLLEIAKAADPQPAIVWASSSSVYGLRLFAAYLLPNPFLLLVSAVSPPLELNLSRRNRTLKPLYCRLMAQKNAGKLSDSLGRSSSDGLVLCSLELKLTSLNVLIR